MLCRRSAYSGEWWAACGLHCGLHCGSVAWDANGEGACARGVSHRQSSTMSPDSCIFDETRAVIDDD